MSGRLTSLCSFSALEENVSVRFFGRILECSGLGCRYDLLMLLFVMLKEREEIPEMHLLQP